MRDLVVDAALRKAIGLKPPEVRGGRAVGDVSQVAAHLVETHELVFHQTVRPVCEGPSPRSLPRTW